ncbi:DUF4232 domain-containing protein [Streptomyces sp. HNM0574]|uniref:DUF4232 domain-containing protein n=1 Tax=Streptomyces sp. HNM0574 TaxID=2714954 RepID=UPI001469BAFC|nr:DUF4232 domain-containing protein [Streptomyces sp. HNM0574]NLU68302.1 DUF4232 domain-containing protein [Streptomyces sp. HNM0574]
MRRTTRPTGPGRARRTARTAGLVTAAAAAVFALTACQDEAANSAATGGSSADSTAKGTGPADPGAQDPGSTGGGTEPGAGGTGGSGEERTTCTVGKVAVGLQETGGSAPVVLLKATNNGSARCDLYGHPFVGHPDAQSPLPAGGGTPQSVVSLEPGASAYASLGLAEGEGADVHREKRLTVELADREGQGTGATAEVTSPGPAGLALGEDSTVSYWNDTLEGAMR